MITVSVPVGDGSIFRHPVYRFLARIIAFAAGPITPFLLGAGITAYCILLLAGLVPDGGFTVWEKYHGFGDSGMFRFFVYLYTLSSGLQFNRAFSMNSFGTRMYVFGFLWLLSFGISQEDTILWQYGAVALAYILFAMPVTGAIWVAVLEQILRLLGVARITDAKAKPERIVRYPR